MWLWRKRSSLHGSRQWPFEGKPISGGSVGSPDLPSFAYLSESRFSEISSAVAVVQHGQPSGAGWNAGVDENRSAD